MTHNDIPPCDEDYLTAKETSQVLRIGERNLRNGANEGRYPHHRHGNRLLFCTADRLVIARLNHHAVRTLMPAAPRKAAKPRRALATAGI